MDKNYDNDKIRIVNMLDNINFCIENTKNIDENEYSSNIKTQYALNMALQIICENANHISDEVKKLSPTTKWNEIRTTRNLISHEYGLIMLDVLYDTITTDLPILKKELEDILVYIDLIDKLHSIILNSNINIDQIEREIANKPISEKIVIIKNEISKYNY